MKEEHSHERASGDDVIERILELEPWKAAAGTGNSSRPSICIPSVRIRTGKTSNHLSLAGVDRVYSE
jgi:hypothetical protein